MQRHLQREPMAGLSLGRSLPACRQTIQHRHQSLQTGTSTACDAACRRAFPAPACLPAHPQKKLEASSLEAKPTTVELYWRTASGTSAAAVGPGAAVVKRGN